MSGKPILRPEIDHVEFNLVLAHGGAEAWYRLYPWPWDLAPEAEKNERLDALADAMTDLAHLSIGIQVVPRQHDVREHLLIDTDQQQQLGQAASEYRSRAESLLSEHRQETTEYLYFLRARLPSVPDLMPAGTGLQTVLQAPRRLASWLTGYGKEWPLSTIEAFKRDEHTIYAALSALLPCRRAEPAELEWLIRRNLWRGIAEPPLRGRGPRGQVKAGALGAVLVPHREAIVTMMEGDLERDPLTGFIALKQLQSGGQVRAFPAFLTISHLPDAVRSPGFEFCFAAQELPFPVECYIRQDGIDYLKAGEALRIRQGQIDEQKRDCELHQAAMPTEAMEAEAELTELAHVVQSQRLPLIDAHYVLCVWGRTPEERGNRVTLLTNHLKALGLEVQCPPGLDQWQLFVQAFPGVPVLLRDYVQRGLTPRLAAAGMPLATSALGDPSGWPWALVGSQRLPVYVDCSRPARENFAPAWLIVGDPGSGKSRAAKHVAAAHVVTRLVGSETISVCQLDPKGEADAIPLHLTELKGQVGVYRLDPQQHGVLDPFLLFPPRRSTPEENGIRMQLAASICLSLLGRTDAETDSAVMLAVTKADKADQPCMATVVQYLDERAPALADLLRTYAEWPMASLLFARDADAAHGVDMRHLWNILQFPHLSLPLAGSKPADWTAEERISQAILQSMVCLAWTFTLSRPAALKMLLLDELHILRATDAGRRLIEKLLRMCRTYQVYVIGITQGADDLDSDTLAGLFTTISVFRTGNAAAAEQALRLLQMDVTPDNIRLVSQLRKAVDTEGRGQEPECLYRDLQGRIGVVSVPTPVPSWNRAFDTRPAARAEALRAGAGR